MTELAVGATLKDRYKLEAELGRGGMGTVYRAHDQTLNRDVAIKVLSGATLGTRDRDRLLNEAQAIAKLNHANIVAVYDAGQISGAENPEPYIVMEYVSGPTLHDSPPSDFADIVDIAKQVCQALDHAHSQGVVHRDLKPENVLLQPDGTAKLMDFGLARPVASRITETGEIVGTVFYLAPELALGQPFDGRADLYALGIMLYELCSGELPFVHDDPLAVISQHIHSSVVPPSARKPELPPLLDALIVRLIRKQPDDRPSSAQEVIAVLQRSDLLDLEAEGERDFLVLDRIVRGRFVGRERELREARSLWSKATAGDGQTLLVSGEPGIGKTRLMRELSTHVQVTGGRALVGACYSEGGAPYAPFAQILRESLENRAGRGNGAGFELPEFVLADLLNLAPELKPYYPDIPPNPPLEPEARQQRLFENVVAFCGILSQDAPLLLVIEDAHWADSGSLSLIRHLARRLRRKPVMLMATYREVELDEARPFHEVLLDLNRERLAHRLKLSRLTREQTEALLAAIFEEEIIDEFLEGIYRETEGNPFFVEEVCKALVEAGQVFLTEDGWDRLSMEELEIPQSIRVAIQARVSTMPEQHQEAMRMAAILGREFNYDTLAAASDLEETALIEAIEAAEHAQLIEGAAGVMFAFVHALVPSTLVEGIHTLRRRIMHRQAAAAIEGLFPEDYEALAYHHGEAGNDEQALKYYTQAGDHAAAAYANREAEDHYRAALNLAEDDQVQAPLLSNLGLAIASQGRFDEAIEAWNTAISIYESLGQSERAAWCFARSARAAWDSGDHLGGLRISEKGIAAVDGGPDSVELADLLHETARAYYFNGIPDQARRYCARSREMAERFGAVHIQVEALITWAFLEGTPVEESIPALERAVDLAREHELPDSEARARQNLAITVGIHTGDADATRQHLSEAARIAHATGQFPMEIFSRSTEVLWAMMQGDLAYGAMELQRLRQLSDDLPNPGAHTFLLTRMNAHLAHFRGEFAQAGERYRENIDASRAGGSLQDVFFNGIWYSEMLIELNLFEEGKAVLLDIIDIGDKLGWATRSRLRLAVLEAKLGEVESAEQLLAAGEKQFAEQPTAFDSPWLEMARAYVALANARTTEAWEHFSDSVDQVRRMGLRGRLGVFLREWAQALIEHGEREDLSKAEELLEEARELFREIDAPGYAERVEAKLESLDPGAS